MLSKIKEKLLNLSNSYVFYKNNYEKLYAINENNKQMINVLKEENIELKECYKNLVDDQKKLESTISGLFSSNKDYSLQFEKIVSNQENQNQHIQSILQNNMNILFNQNKQNEISTSILNKEQENQNIFLNQMKISDASQKLQMDKLLIKQENQNQNISTILQNNTNILSNQNKQNEISTNILTKEEEINESCLRIEKSSVHSNIKLDSKFNENQRFIDNKIEYLVKKSNYDNLLVNSNINLSENFPEKVNVNLEYESK